MHDIDHTRIHDNSGYESWGPVSPDRLSENGPFEFESSEGESPCASNPGNPECEALEMELATEFLEINSEEELDSFAGSVVRRLYGRSFKDRAGRYLAHAVKDAARRVLPTVGGCGGCHGVTPGARANPVDAGRLMGLELEGLSGEDQEFEVARQFIRFVRDMIRHFRMAGSTGNHHAAARDAALNSARVNAPGLVRSVHDKPGPQQVSSSYPGQSGRWFRRGRKIIIYGA